MEAETCGRSGSIARDVDPLLPVCPPSESFRVSDSLCRMWVMSWLLEYALLMRVFVSLGTNVLSCPSFWSKVLIRRHALLPDCVSFLPFVVQLSKTWNDVLALGFPERTIEPFMLSPLPLSTSNRHEFGWRWTPKLT